MNTIKKGGQNKTKWYIFNLQKHTEDQIYTLSELINKSEAVT